MQFEGISNERIVAEVTENTGTSFDAERPWSRRKRLFGLVPFVFIVVSVHFTR